MARPNPFASLPKFRRGSFALFLLVAILTAFLGDQPVAQRLILVPGTVNSGQDVWQPLTALFVYPDGAVGMVLGTLFIQWFIGSELEGFWGPKKYLLLVLGSALAGHLTSVLLGFFVPSVAATPVGGMTGVDLAAVTAFGVVFGSRPLRLFAALPLKARGLAMLVVGLTVLGPVVRGASWPVVMPWVVSIGVALLVTTQPWRRLRDSGKLGGSKKVKKRHLRVVSPEPKLLN